MKLARVGLIAAAIVAVAMAARVELLHAGGGDFFTQTAPLTFRFADDKQSLILQGGQDRLTLTRVKP